MDSSVNYYCLTCGLKDCVLPDEQYYGDPEHYGFETLPEDHINPISWEYNVYHAPHILDDFYCSFQDCLIELFPNWVAG